VLLHHLHAGVERLINSEKTLQISVASKSSGEDYGLEKKDCIAAFVSNLQASKSHTYENIICNKNTTNFTW
jgi:hypothetical protein